MHGEDDIVEKQGVEDSAEEPPTKRFKAEEDPRHEGDDSDGVDSIKSFL